jgi:hypothetical protein
MYIKKNYKRDFADIYVDSIIQFAKGLMDPAAKAIEHLIVILDTHCAHCG